MRFTRVMSVLGLTLWGLLLAHPGQGQVPPHHWSHRYGASGADQGVDIATDPSGNVVVFGHFRGTVDFGGGPLVSAGRKDLFVAKFGPGGDHLWSVRFGSSDDEWARAVAVDGDGGIYLTGSFTTAINFGGGYLVPAGQDDIYLVKLNADGSHVWSRKFGDADRDTGLDLAVEGSGFHVYLTGTFRGTVDFGGGPLANAGRSDIFLAKFKTTTGSHVWSLSYGANGYDGGQAVAVDGNGDIVLAGYFEGTVDFGGGPLASSGGDDVCLVKLDKSAVYLWSRSGGGSEDDRVNGVTVDALNNVILAGSFRSVADFGSGLLASQGEEDIFLAKYAADGHPAWSRGFGGADADAANSVAANALNQIYLTGYCGESVDFGGGVLGNSGGSDICLGKFQADGAHMWSDSYGSFGMDTGMAVTVDGAGNVSMTGSYDYYVNFGGDGLYSRANSVDLFVASLDGAGAHRWSDHFGGLGWDYAHAVATDMNGNVFVTGFFCGSVSFGGGALHSAGERDIFLVKFDEEGNHLWSRSFGGVSYFDDGMGVAVDGAGKVYVTGFFSGTVDFGGGPLSAVGDYDIFLAKYDTNGNHIWSRRFGDDGPQMGFALAVGPLGDVALAGHCTGIVDFGGGPIGGSGFWNVYVAVFDPSGAHLWSRCFDSPGGDYCYTVAMDAAGNTIIAGCFSDTIDLGGGPLFNHGDLDAFIASYNPSGVNIFSRAFGSTGDDAVQSVSVDPNGNIFATGRFEEIVDWGGGPLASSGLSDVVLAKYTVSGAHVWSQCFGATDSDEGRSVDVDETGEILLAGNFRGDIDLGGGPLASESAQDIFLAKFGSSGNHLWSESAGGYLDDFVGAAILDGPETVVLAGQFRGAIDLGGGELASTGGIDVFVARLGQDPSAIGEDTGGPLSRWAVGHAAPNPSHDGVSITLEGLPPGPTTVGVYDVTGRLVRAILRRELGPGRHDVVWDGRDSSGHRVAPGVYALRVASARSAVTRKVVLVE